MATDNAHTQIHANFLIQQTNRKYYHCAKSLRASFNAKPMKRNAQDANQAKSTMPSSH